MKAFHLQIVTPDGPAYDGPAEKVLVRTTHGDVCILARHVDYVSALGMGECQVTLEGGDVRRAACIGGMITVSGGIVRVVASAFEWAEDIDVARAQRSKEKAEKALAHELSGRETRIMEAKLKRALVRLKVHG